MGALEVIVLHEQRQPPLAVLEVGEHRPREQLLPQRLPEALDLAAGLRVVRAALHVLDAVTLELGLELRRAAPGGVLPALIGEDLARCAIVRDTTGQCFEHQRAPLVMRHRKTHQVARVIIQKRRDVQPLVPAQQKREQVRLPQLVRLGALEARRLALHSCLGRCAPLKHPFSREHPLHRRR